MSGPGRVVGVSVAEGGAGGSAALSPAVPARCVSPPALCGCGAGTRSDTLPGCARRHCSKTLTLREAEGLCLTPCAAGLGKPWRCDPPPFWRGTLVWVLPAERSGWSNACFMRPAAQPAERLPNLLLLGEAFVNILGCFFPSLPPLTVVEVWHSKYFSRCRFGCLAERI